MCNYTTRILKELMIERRRGKKRRHRNIVRDWGSEDDERKYDEGLVGEKEKENNE